jgi:SAM-dependent methyltransferase
MSFESILKNAQNFQIDDAVTAPAMYQGVTNFLTPDQIVHFCISRYNLINNGVRVLDPMCGLGTIPRVINECGGDCVGIEIDADRFNVALSVLDKNKLKLGDYLTLELPKYSFHCIFTSLPCEWFKQHHEHVPPDHAKRFKQLLAPKSFILLDSVPTVIRAGQKWPVAARQCDYLEHHGFSLVEMIKFNSDEPANKKDESIVMKFTI